MTKSVKNFSGVSAVCTIYVLGSLVITAPFKSTNRYTFLELIILALAGILTSLVALPLVRKFVNFTPKSAFLRLVFIAVCVAVSVYSLLCAADTFKDLLSFVKTVVLPRTAGYIICAVLFLSVIWFSTKTRQTLLKFSLVFGAFAVAVIIIFFVGLFENYDFDNIIIKNLPNFEILTSGISDYVFQMLFPLFPLFVFISLDNKKSHSKAAFLGVISGFLMLLLCIAGSILLFGPDLAGELDFAYSQFISTFTVGRLFTRLDFFAYFLFFITSISKIWVLGQTVKELLRLISGLFPLLHRR